MTLYLIGTQEEKDCNGEGCAECEFKIEDKSTSACVLDVYATAATQSAREMTVAVGRDSATLARLAEEAAALFSDDEQRLSAEWITDFISEATALEEALPAKLGHSMRCDQAIAERAAQRYDGTLAFETDADGTKHYTVIHPWWKVKAMLRFLRRANELDRGVAIE